MAGRDPDTSAPSRAVVALTGMSVTLIGLFLLSLIVGSTAVPVGRVIEVVIGTGRAADSAADIVSAIRLPRSCTAMLAGASLGIAGLQMQTLFKNPLADPFALGISSGASLGVALVVLGSGYSIAAALGSSMGVQGDLLVAAAAIVGAATVLAVVLLLST